MVTWHFTAGNTIKSQKLALPCTRPGLKIHLNHYANSVLVYKPSPCISQSKKKSKLIINCKKKEQI